MRVGSPRWFFENRETGEITVAQFPNWPLFGVAAGWIVRALAPNGSVLEALSGASVTLLWVYWGADELIRGVNPWRRLLGLGVLVWQLARVTGLGS